MFNQAKVLEWENLLQISKKGTTVHWKSNPDQSPATVVLSSHLSQIREGDKPLVVLYLDTNAWCPFCERVWFVLEEKKIPFDVELIDLNNKPKWYTDMVPTGLVPAVKIEGELFYESKTILLELESRFAKIPLLPENPQEKTVASEMIEACEKGDLFQAGFKFISSLSEQNQELEELESDLELNLNEIEKALQKYPGDYFLRDFSLVDLMYIPILQRFSANLPVFRGYNLRGNEKYPLLNRWLQAMNNRRVYQIIKPDDNTNHILGKNLFKLKPIRSGLELIPDYNGSDPQQDRFEAAAKLSDNHKTVTKDILENSGIKAWVNEDSCQKVQEYIDLSLRFLADYLIQGGSTSLETYEIINHREVAAIGAISLSYIRNRVCVPRDLSAGAAKEFRTAIDKIVSSIYSYST